MSGKNKTVVLVILDGWGNSDSTEYNAIYSAKKPVYNRLLKEHPHTEIATSGSSVGLPAGQMGNSEVGHLNLGAGRVVYQEITRISRSIRTGSFFENLTLTDAVDLAIENKKAVHIVGLLSPGGVHSHEDHIHALVKLAVERGAKQVYLHAFTDGRDMPPKSAQASLEKMQEVFEELGSGRIVSMVGRYFAMDRDHRWDRVQCAYDLMIDGIAKYEADDPLTALEMAYDRGETDEFIKPTRIGETVKINEGDVVVNMNFRSDRARQITRPFIELDFDGFSRDRLPKLGRYVSLTEYNRDFDIPVAFPPERLKNVFGEHISNLGLRQLRIAETEKYAHVTFFYNGGLEAPFEGEDRILIPSPQVATYDLMPEMSARQLTDDLTDAIDSGDYDAIICNYANGDMVGHTGNFDAAVSAVETLDECLGRVLKAVHRSKAELLITADHGNCEQMMDPEIDQPYTAHTTNPVPLIYVGNKDITLHDQGALCDISPTMLNLMGLEIPREMSGRSLISDGETSE